MSIDETMTCRACAEDIPSGSVRCPICQVSNPGDVGAAQPAVPAGWYDDPDMVNTRRYWDGSAWTAHRVEAGTPGPGPAAPTTAPGPKPAKQRSYLRVDSTYAWALAAVPLLIIAIPLAFPGVYNEVVGLVVAVLSCVFARQDEKRVQAAGYESAGAGWALLAGVAYLFARSRRVGGPLIAIVWCATLLAALGAYNVVGPVTLDTAFVEQSITNDLNDAATVTCPDREVLRMNDSFYCIATNGSDTVRYLVTLTGHDGTFTWIPVG